MTAETDTRDWGPFGSAPTDGEAIRRRDRDWATADWGTDPEQEHREHPETWCWADRDRRALLDEIDRLRLTLRDLAR